MARPPYIPRDPESPDEWLRLAARELEDARIMLVGGGSPEAVYQHAGQSIENLLKALIWKRERWNMWPDSKREPDLYRHNLNKMLRRAGLAEELEQNKDVAIAWRVVREWKQQPRYAANSMPRKIALDMIRCVRHPDYGVYHWLIRRFQMR